MSLKKEISRLYQKGKTKKPFISSCATELLMRLYLLNKYNIKDPIEEKFREENKQYEIDIDNVSMKLPDYYCLELELYYDDKQNLIRTNREDYYSYLYWRIVNMIKDNPGKKIISSFDIVMYINDVQSDGHTEVIIYDPILNTIEHIDSNNVPKHCTRQNRDYFICCEIVTSIMYDIIKVLPQEPIYINNDDIYSRYEWGIQSLESSSNLLLDDENGYCLMWSSLFGDFALSFPEYSIKQIIEEIIKKAKSKLNNQLTINDYLLFMIRGYVSDLSDKLDVSFDDEVSQYNACIRLVI